MTLARQGNKGVRILLAVMVQGLVCLWAQAAPPKESLAQMAREVVRVRLASDKQEVQFTARELKLVNPQSIEMKTWAAPEQGEKLLNVRIERSRDQSRLVFSVLKGRKRISRLELGEQLPLSLHLENGRLNGKRMPPEIAIDWIDGQIEIRSDLNLNEYLLGVVSREMPGQWPMDALKAQAVATRSYTLSQMNTRSDWSFDLESTVLDQEFEWTPSAKEGPLRRWQEALDATTNEVLLDRQGKVFRAYYHADCGGRTTTPDFVWGTAGDYKSVRDPSCEVRNRSKWRWSAAKSWIQNQLAQGFGQWREPAGVKSGIEFSWIQSLFDGRVTLVEWWDGVTQLKMLSGQNFRQLLGFSQLKSLRFSSREQGDKIVFEGRGFGHGVGLCQWGSKDWAEQGQTYQKILEHYYPLAQRGKLNEVLGLRE